VNYYNTKSGILPGADYKRVYKNAWRVFSRIKKQTKRKPYIRSAYFDKEKVFFDYFWQHLMQKPPKERMRRLRFFKAAIELIHNIRTKPNTILIRSQKNIRLHRFTGQTKSGEIFFVQIKEHIVKKSKQFMSVFPEK